MESHAIIHSAGQVVSDSVPCSGPQFDSGAQERGTVVRTVTGVILLEIRIHEYRGDEFGIEIREETSARLEESAQDDEFEPIPQSGEGEQQSEEPRDLRRDARRESRATGIAGRCSNVRRACGVAASNSSGPREAGEDLLDVVRRHDSGG